MIRPHDAWALARLLAVEAVNGEVQPLSEPFRRIAEDMAALPLEDRGAAWEAYLTGRADGDEIIRAVADADPEAPAPEAEPDDDEDTAAGWEPIRLGALPPAEPFPLDVLPAPARDLAEAAARSIGCPVDFPAVAILAVAAGAIGQSVALKVKNGYFSRANVYAGIVGPPSDGKTPAMKAVAVALRRIDAILEAEYRQARERWEEESGRPGPDGKKQKPPAPPKPRRIDVDDITTEALPLILADNPRGLIMVRDELTALFLGMNQFKAGGKGNDRPNFLKIWSGDAIKKDRVGHEDNVPIRCPHPCLTILGGLPPDMLGSMLDPKGRADGFVDRYLLSYPEPLPVADWSESGIPEEVTDAWCALVAHLWARPMNVKEGQVVPHAAFFTPEGIAAWREHYNAHAAEMNAPDFPPAMRGPWGKLREYAARLALDLACLDHAADPTADPVAVPRVGVQAVAGAWRLVAYFKAHLRRVHSAISPGAGVGIGPVVKAIVDWLRHGRRLSFTERDIKQARRWIKDADLTKALAYLTACGAIRLREAPSDHPKGGRPPSPGYDVNPELLDSQNPRNTRNPDLAGDDDPRSEDSESSEN